MTSSPHARAARPAFVPGVQQGGCLALSGQLGVDKHGNLVDGGISAQTVQALRNLKAVLAGFGRSTDSLVKVNLFLVDIDDLPVVNEIYVDFLDGRLPARTAVQVSRLPRDAAIEIEAWATADEPSTRQGGAQEG